MMATPGAMSTEALQPLAWDVKLIPVCGASV